MDKKFASITDTRGKTGLYFQRVFEDISSLKTAAYIWWQSIFMDFRYWPIFLDKNVGMNQS